MEKKKIELRDLFLEIRNRINLTQKEFADTLNVSRSTIAKIENKQIAVSDKLLYYFFGKYRKYLEDYDVYSDMFLDDDSKKPAKGLSNNLLFLKVKDFFREDDEDNTYFESMKSSNNEFKKNMDRLVFLERENEILRAKLETQNEFIKQLLEKNLSK